MCTMVTLVSLLLVGALASAADIRQNAVVYRKYLPPAPPKTSGINEFPGMVSLHNADGAVCSGSALDALHVLTSGRCGTLLENAQSTARSGSSFATSGGRVHSIVDIKVHPSYNARTFDYDVAVLKVDSKTPFEQSEFVELDKSAPVLETYQPLSVYGWGFFSENVNFSVEVQPFLGNGECNRILSGSFSPVKLVTDRMLCTLIEPRYPKSYNFGSPVLTTQKKQIAISSWNRQRPDDIVTMHTDLRNKEIQDFIASAL